jgi:hypothetical protein
MQTTVYHEDFSLPCIVLAPTADYCIVTVDYVGMVVSAQWA